MYQREKEGTVYKKLICCGTCKAFIGSRAFYRPINCQKKHCKKRINIPVALLETPNDINLDDDFKTNILAKLRDYEVGRLCQTDRTILQIGSVFYRQVHRKKDKAVQVRRTVRIEMRRLGFLYFELKKDKITKQHNNVQDMFIQNNFDSLRDAIDNYSTSDEGNLKAKSGFSFKRSAKVIKAIAMSQGKERPRCFRN